MKILSVCATYGRLPYLGRMLSSFIGQTYDDKHLVIINDDINIQLCCDRKDVTVLNCNKRLYVSEKRNLGIASGHHDLIIPWDDDDVYLPTFMAHHHKQYDDKTLTAYRNDRGYVVYGNDFKIDRVPENCMSFLKTQWFKVGGYYNPQRQAEDIELYNKMLATGTMRDISDESIINFVYNFGGLNYHLSGDERTLNTIDEIAYNQLEKLNLVGKKFWIEPDFEQFNNFLILEKLWKDGKRDMTVEHVGDSKIRIDHLL